MVAIQFEDIIGPCIITSVSSLQMVSFARRVGKARQKYKVPPPETTGDEGFVRIFRAHQNSVEFYPVFLASLWSSSLLFHQVPPTVLGVVYMLARSKYFKGYSESAEKRLPGFKVSVTALVGLGICSFLGTAHILFTKYTGNSLFSYFN
ncbi:microsomal glutathione S-transferase 2 isoform X2 [Hydra vulgaris]|uniref:Microsomal glutathione S-transferase 2 isoform X2 n=1 Tax=Hydra vulgaris TaxID=6087 RepID=A0ABM4DDR1_HYDVU